MTEALASDQFGHVWVDGDYWGKIERPHMSVTSHAAYRFHQRARPDVRVGDCASVIQGCRNNIVGYRLNRRNDGTWYLMHEDGFTLVAAPEFRVSGRFVRQVWRVITVLAGHEHF